jgi:hypothetical protein
VLRKKLKYFTTVRSTVFKFQNKKQRKREAASAEEYQNHIILSIFNRHAKI